MQATRQLSLAFGSASSESDETESTRTVESRNEPREETVRRVEYTSFPRSAADSRARVGFTRNVSDSGMALGVDEVLPVGTLLRVVVQKPDGAADFDAVARVAWCHEARERSARTPNAWLGMVLVAEIRRGLARVPHSATSPVRGAA